MIEGYFNVDSVPLDGVDLVYNLDRYPYPFEDNTFEEVNAHNVLEHLSDIIKPMEEIWRISKPKAKIIIEVPPFYSHCAADDPTHKVFFTYVTFDYFRPEDYLNYMTKARFNILQKKITFHKWLSFLNPIINLNRYTQKAYHTFFYYFIPSESLHFELEVVK